MFYVWFLFVASNADLSTMEQTLPWTATNILLNPPIVLREKSPHYNHY